MTVWYAARLVGFSGRWLRGGAAVQLPMLVVAEIKGNR